MLRIYILELWQGSGKYKHQVLKSGAQIQKERLKICIKKVRLSVPLSFPAQPNKCLPLCFQKKRSVYT